MGCLTEDGVNFPLDGLKGGSVNFPLDGATGDSVNVPLDCMIVKASENFSSHRDWLSANLLTNFAPEEKPQPDLPQVSNPSSLSSSSICISGLCLDHNRVLSSLASYISIRHVCCNGYACIWLRFDSKRYLGENWFIYLFLGNEQATPMPGRLRRAHGTRSISTSSQLGIHIEVYEPDKSRLVLISFFSNVLKNFILFCLVFWFRYQETVIRGLTLSVWTFIWFLE